MCPLISTIPYGGAALRVSPKLNEMPMHIIKLAQIWYNSTRRVLFMAKIRIIIFVNGLVRTINFMLCKERITTVATVVRITRVITVKGAI